MVRARTEQCPEALHDLARQGYRFVLVVSLGTIAVFIPSRHELATFVFGPQHAPSATPAALLMWALLFAAAGGRRDADGRHAQMECIRSWYGQRWGWVVCLYVFSAAVVLQARYGITGLPSYAFDLDALRAGELGAPDCYRVLEPAIVGGLLQRVMSASAAIQSCQATTHLVSPRRS